MHYCIIKKRSRLVFLAYEYYWPSDKFFWEFGTMSRRGWTYGDLPFNIVAEISYEYFEKRFSTEYPEDNTLTIKVLDDTVITEDMVRNMKGFKKFFGHMNIKDIAIKGIKT